MKYITLILMTVLLSSCSLFSPVKMNSTTYLLNEIPDNVVTTRTRHITLLVMPPNALPAYNTTLMAYTTCPYQIAYFAKNQWASTPPQMLHPLIVQTMQNTPHFYAVVSPPVTGSYEYVLNTQILELLQDFTRRPAVLRFTVRAQISRVATNRVIATRVFSIKHPMRVRAPCGGVYAANIATQQLLQQLAAFSVSKTK
jgi:cholesterol transport system auxiliary component